MENGGEERGKRTNSRVEAQNKRNGGRKDTGKNVSKERRTQGLKKLNTVAKSQSHKWRGKLGKKQKWNQKIEMEVYRVGENPINWKHGKMLTR